MKISASEVELLSAINAVVLLDGMPPRVRARMVAAVSAMKARYVDEISALATAGAGLVVAADVFLAATDGRPRDWWGGLECRHAIADLAHDLQCYFKHDAHTRTPVKPAKPAGRAWERKAGLIG